MTEEAIQEEIFDEEKETEQLAELLTEAMEGESHVEEESEASGEGSSDSGTDTEQSVSTETKQNLQNQQSSSDTTEQEQTLTAPQSWSPKDREDWGKLPENVKSQVMKREKEITTMLQESSEARKQMAQFSQMLQPYQSFFTANGVDPMKGVNGALQTLATLQGGTKEAKAATAAKLIQSFGVDIRSLDNMLVGKYKAAPKNPEVEQLNKKLSQMEQYIQQQQYQQNQQIQHQQQAIDTDVQSFVQSHEFAQDLRLDMADIMDLKEARGEKITLQQAYDQALALRPDLQEIMRNRQNSQNNVSSLDRARQANVSLPSSGMPDGTPAAPTDLRGALEAAWDN